MICMNPSAYSGIMEKLKLTSTGLLAVSKTKSVDEIKALYDLGHRDFGENYVQELIEKEALLPKDIRWHFIGHLQTNKVKYLAPFIFMIQSVDSLKLLLEIDKHAARNQRSVRCLFQIFIASEETKFGLSDPETEDLILAVKQNRQEGKLIHTRISGCMGMASLTDNKQRIRSEFDHLKTIFERIKKSFPADPVDTLSMGMSSDFQIAIEAGSTMVRIGSLLFGERQSK
jgi:PLP dependent protein